MSGIKLNLGQLNMKGAFANLVGSVLLGFVGSLVTVTVAGVNAGMPLGKAIAAGTLAGGAAAATAATTNVSGFLTQRTVGADGTAPVGPSLTSTDTASIGTATVSRFADAVVNPDYQKIVDITTQIAQNKLAELKQSEATQKANAAEAATLRARLAELERGTSTSPAGAIG